MTLAENAEILPKYEGEKLDPKTTQRVQRLVVGLPLEIKAHQAGWLLEKEIPIQRVQVDMPRSWMGTSRLLIECWPDPAYRFCARIHGDRGPGEIKLKRHKTSQGRVVFLESSIASAFVTQIFLFQKTLFKIYF